MRKNDSMLFLSDLHNKKEMAMALNVDAGYEKYRGKFMSECMLIVHHLFVLVAHGKC